MTHFSVISRRRTRNPIWALARQQEGLPHRAEKQMLTLKDLNQVSEFGNVEIHLQKGHLSLNGVQGAEQLPARLWKASHPPPL